MNGGNDNITAVVVRVMEIDSTGTDREVTPIPPARTHG
jgi:serine/threonine protein phosphatase PrpC